MCFVRTDEETIRRSGKRERTAAEWIDMAEQIARAGTLYLLLTGGEVTLRPDFPEIYEAIARMGFILTVYTNATMITDRIMDLFRSLPPHEIGVTMYGASNETYEKLCGDPRGYDHFLSGLERLQELPSLLDMRTTIVRDNLQDLEAMAEFTKSRFGPEKVLHLSAHLYPATRGAVEDPRKVRLSAEEMFDICYPELAALKKSADAGLLDLRKPGPGSTLRKLEKELRRRGPAPDGGYLFRSCEAGISSYFISWDGGMYACGTLPKGCTHPFEEGFDQAWADLPKQYPPARLNTECKSCRYLPYCESCPAQRILESGDWEGVPEYACEAAKVTKAFLDSLHAVT
jgi:radical SAM protein with 4Fe4S-binding SPASM domain